MAREATRCHHRIQIRIPLGAKILLILQGFPQHFQPPSNKSATAEPFSSLADELSEGVRRVGVSVRVHVQIALGRNPDRGVAEALTYDFEGDARVSAGSSMGPRTNVLLPALLIWRCSPGLAAMADAPRRCCTLTRASPHWEPNADTRSNGATTSSSLHCMRRCAKTSLHNFLTESATWSEDRAVEEALHV